jgi:hypothetical protein
MKLLIGILTSLILNAAPALCQNEDFPDSAARREAAALLLDAMQTERAHLAHADQVVQRFRSSGTADTSSALASTVQELFDGQLSWQALKPDYIELYAATFTADELRRLAAFYRTPLGQKLAMAAPALSEGSMRIAEDRLAGQLPLLLERMNLNR